MANDFMRLDDQGRRIGDLVGLGDAVHAALFDDLPPGAFPLLSRMDDYYGHAGFEVRELSRLIDELQRLRAARPDALGDVLERMIMLVETARQHGHRVGAFAD